MVLMKIILKWINQFVDSIDLMKLKLEIVIFYFTGGYPDKMMAKFQKYDLVHELENLNGIMIGTSAGNGSNKRVPYYLEIPFFKLSLTKGTLYLFLWNYIFKYKVM